MSIHVAYRDEAERTAWGCLCEGVGLCVMCSIRALIRKHYGQGGMEAMEERLWPSILKAKVLEMGSDAGRVLLIMASEEVTDAMLKQIEGVHSTILEPAAKAAGRDTSVPFTVVFEQMEAEWANDERMAALGYVRKSTLGGPEAKLAALSALACRHAETDEHICPDAILGILEIGGAGRPAQGKQGR